MPQVRLVAVLLIGGAGTAWAAAAPASKPGASRDCPVVRPVFAASTEAVVTVRRKFDGRVYYGCVRRVGRTRRIGDFDGESGLIRVRLSGRLVAYDDAICEVTCSGGVSIQDLATGRRELVQATPAGGGNAEGLELLPDGGVIWIRRRSAAGGLEVIKRDGDGLVVLDSGPAVAADSLAVSGRRAYWTRGGAPQTALLRPMKRQ